jgi:hypothetical protein
MDRNIGLWKIHVVYARVLVPISNLIDPHDNVVSFATHFSDTHQAHNRRPHCTDDWQLKVHARSIDFQLWQSKSGEVCSGCVAGDRKGAFNGSPDKSSHPMPPYLEVALIGGDSFQYLLLHSSPVQSVHGRRSSSTTD